MSAPQPKKRKENWAYFLKRPVPPTPEQLAERKRVLAAYLAKRPGARSPKERA